MADSTARQSTPSCWVKAASSAATTARLAAVLMAVVRDPNVSNATRWLEFSKAISLGVHEGRGAWVHPVQTDNPGSHHGQHHHNQNRHPFQESTADADLGLIT